MSFLGIYSRKSIGLLQGSLLKYNQTLVCGSSLSMYSRQAGKAPAHGGKAKKGVDAFDEDTEGQIQQTKISKQSMTKIIQRFTKIYKKPEKSAPQTEEEQKLRKFITGFNKYRQEIINRRDKESRDKLNLQWEAVMELPEDLRKIAMLIDTHDEQPALLQHLTWTPPTKGDPKQKIQMKKKDKSLKRSQRFIENTGSQS
ncbi:hypothetical protein DLAC_08782 [Tieghemostelium lacteum]|uniref:Uncharacterized protein n=1 Tax=Tieghemostelium lacteum TaxID=361077 RepID=A0A151Z8P5_TIELA|nr:hypothetical protein DLAC_08782 [Tieghemostelium lacteum]|eukprot:KYQ90184.1 hypothetical protein DLAC_08782 [Tieghemostelium lacteum]